MNKGFTSNSGQAIIEFAFVLPLMLVLLLGLIEFGVLFYDKAMITNASREGARAGIVYNDPDGDGDHDAHPNGDMENAVNNYLQGKLINFGGMASWSTNVVDNQAISPGGIVRIAVTYQHTFLVFGRFLGLGDTINIGAETSMRVE